MGNMEAMYRDPTSLFFNVNVEANDHFVQTKQAAAIPKIDRLKSTAIPPMLRFDSRQKPQLSEGLAPTLPLGTMNVYFYSANTQPAIASKAYTEKYKALQETLKQEYLKSGTKAPLIQEVFAKDLLPIFQSFRLASNSLLFADGAAGIYRALTGGYTRYFTYFDITYKKKAGVEVIDQYYILATLDQLVKCFFGLCVNEYGQFKPGTSEILKRSGIVDEFRAALIGCINGTSKGREPNLLVYDSAKNIIGVYKPIVFKEYDTKTKLFKVYLDPRFFALKNDKGVLTADNRFLPTIGGLYSVCTVGRVILGRKTKGASLPETPTIAKFIHTIQAASNAQTLMGFHLETGNPDKIKVRIDREGLKTLFPTCYDSKEKYLNWKTASNTAGLASFALYAGLSQVGGLTELYNNTECDRIILPSIAKTAYFDNTKCASGVLINCETPKTIVGTQDWKQFLKWKDTEGKLNTIGYLANTE